MSLEHVDVLIIGAGLSGIGAGYHLQQRCPGRSFAILESRDAIGGTWDLFRYPGIRSDSDMYTLGYSFKPWTQPKAIADGPSILKYVRETAREYGIDQKIRFKHRVTQASWSTQEAKWTIVATRGDSQETVRLTCNFIFMCSGYYNYAAGYTPEFPGVERFAGRIVHPQKWTSDIDYTGKRVVVIGSGATAVTLLPEMAKKAAHVTMLQRSPTYILSYPAQDVLANFMRRYLPRKFAYAFTRWKMVLLGMFFFQISRRAPALVKWFLVKRVASHLGAGYDVGTHFTPRYNPWDQRVCLVPDDDLFEAIKGGNASVVTDHIDTFTEQGLLLRSGTLLEADLIVTATGLSLNVLGDLEVAIDGQRVDFAKTLNYKGMMFSDVPNFVSFFGYTNASWTLKCDLTSGYACRLINHMQDHGYQQCTPRKVDPSISAEPYADFTSGYIQRAVDKLPKQGSRAPWRLYQNYALDLMSLRYGSIIDDTMQFTRVNAVEPQPTAVASVGA